MNVSCPSCSAKYRIADEKIPAQGARITCPSCGHKFAVKPENASAVSVATSSAPSPLSANRPKYPIEDDDEDAPTTVMSHGSALAQELRRTIEETEAARQRAEQREKAPEPASKPSALPVKQLVLGILVAAGLFAVSKYLGYSPI